MSRCFSITIMTRVIRIFSAATNWIRPMVTTVTMRSIFRALEHLLVLLAPGGGGELRPDHFFGCRGHLRRLIDVVEHQFDAVDHVGEVEGLLRVGERQEGPVGVEIVEAGFENSATRRRT